MEEKREFFRVALYNVPITTVIHGLTFEGKVRDVSGAGISFYLTEDVSFEECEVTFTIENQTFTFEAQLIRKGDIKYGTYSYACAFKTSKDKEKAKLSAILFKLDAKKRRG